ncbi:hypothetical protein C6P76_13905 [Burkholderia multivorans]|uniref:hypothetical protein n=1 Tax=Burkholderia multivorans TaxID=87883 RepID=UPI000D00DA04|nr:hypothetical protein [Burkholderia multivorans]PRD86907.1 hypothetical protein C6P76_13905 [Burkholderia multivorans]
MNCKPGDLAYLLNKTGKSQENEGRVFEIVAYRFNHAKFGHLWKIRSVEPLNAFSQKGDPLGKQIFFDCPDDWLRPISGVPVTDDVEDGVTA